jgi:hypothetical protein
MIGMNKCSSEVLPLVYCFQYSARKILGAVIDIGPAMARKILKANWKVMSCTSDRSLTSDEIQSPAEPRVSEVFDTAIKEIIGSSMTEDDFKDDPDCAEMVTPTFQLY